MRSHIHDRPQMRDVRRPGFFGDGTVGFRALGQDQTIVRDRSQAAVCMLEDHRAKRCRRSMPTTSWPVRTSMRNRFQKSSGTGDKQLVAFRNLPPHVIREAHNSQKEKTADLSQESRSRPRDDAPGPVAADAPPATPPTITIFIVQPIPLPIATVRSPSVHRHEGGRPGKSSIVDRWEFSHGLSFLPTTIKKRRRRDSTWWRSSPSSNKSPHSYGAQVAQASRTMASNS